MDKTQSFYHGTHGYYRVLDPEHFRDFLHKSHRATTPISVEVYRSRHPLMVKRVDEDGAPLETQTPKHETH